MKDKLPIFLFILGLIVAFWPTEYLIIKLIAATLIITFAGLNKKIVSPVFGVLIFVGFIAFNSYSKFDSVASYMKVTKDSDVRYADVEELSKNFGVEGWHSYFSEWEKKCLAGFFDYCRLASYVPRVKKEKRAEELLRIGCNNKDFLSCYNYFFYEEFGEEDRKFAGTVIVEQCKMLDLSSEFKDICERVYLFMRRRPIST